MHGPFAVWVAGQSIASVTFYVDGKPVRTLNAVPGRTRFTLRVDPRRQSGRVHRVTARVRFTRNSRKSSVVRRLVYRRTLPRRSPRFTG